MSAIRLMNTGCLQHTCSMTFLSAIQECGDGPVTTTGLTSWFPLLRMHHIAESRQFELGLMCSQISPKVPCKGGGHQKVSMEQSLAACTWPRSRWSSVSKPNVMLLVNHHGLFTILRRASTISQNIHLHLSKILWKDQPRRARR